MGFRPSPYSVLMNDGIDNEATEHTEMSQENLRVLCDCFENSLSVSLVVTFSSFGGSLRCSGEMTDQSVECLNAR